ncbi:EamA family transporter [Prochlorococcus sp. MIT 1223]|uniref:EamA family transporter n=1 Tax=Prochlorococcus sp. MIT 1223 TaxID=3096217 RepID=UPI002A74DDBA|nr:EamA family transporter [Prochlorococcus sp. MIT 1223]
MFGIISALGAASSWTYACYLWRKQTKYLSAAQINITKNIIAFIIFFPIILTFDFQSSFKDIFILFLSGIIGISVGDTFYIISLKKIGTRRTLTVEALSPIIATFLGSVFMEEILPFKVWVGVFIVSISLVGVAFQKTINTQYIISNKDRKEGFIFAIFSVLCAVIAAALSRSVLTQSDLNPFQTTEIRLLGSVFALLPFLGKNLTYSIRMIPLKIKLSLLFATFLGTNIGILLQQNVFKLLPIGLGWTLLSTSPVMALFLSGMEGEEVTWKTYLLTATTILGVGIVFI